MPTSKKTLLKQFNSYKRKPSSKRRSSKRPSSKRPSSKRIVSKRKPSSKRSQMPKKPLPQLPNKPLPKIPEKVIFTTEELPSILPQNPFTVDADPFGDIYRYGKKKFNEIPPMPPGSIYPLGDIYLYFKKKFTGPSKPLPQLPTKNKNIVDVAEEEEEFYSGDEEEEEKKNVKF